MDFHEFHVHITPLKDIPSFSFFFAYVNNTIMAIVWTFEVEATQLSLSVEL
jgi:hypothetical protein